MIFCTVSYLKLEKWAVRWSVLCLLIQSIAVLGLANTTDDVFQIRTLTIRDGLSSQRINEIFQDKEGFLWIGTTQGLDRYDGERLISLSLVDLGLASGHIMRIVQDREGWLWVLSNFPQDITCVHPEELKVLKPGERYLDFTRGENVMPLDMMTTERGEVVVLWSDQTIQKFGPDGIITNIAKPAISIVNLIAPHGENGIWARDKNENLCLLGIDQGPKPSPKIRFPREALSGKVVLGDQWYLPFLETDPAEVEFFHLEPDGTRNTLKVPGINRWLPDVPIYPVLFQQGASNEEVWVVHDQGIGLFQFQNGLKVDLTERVIGSHKIQGIYCSYSDSEGSLWLGTNEGVVHILQQKVPFTRYLDKGDPISLREMFREGDSLFACTYNGMKAIDLKTGNIKGFELKDSETGLPLSSGTTIYASEPGMVWIGDELGIMKWDRDQQVAKYYPFEKGIYAGVWDMLMTGPNKMIIGYEFGVAHLDLEGPEAVIRPYPMDWKYNNPKVNGFFKDNENRNWICTDGGLYRWEIETDGLEYFGRKGDSTHYLPSDQFEYLYQDKEGTYWLGTRGQGLIEWSGVGKKYQIYDKRNGFSNGVIHAIYEDAYHQLWMPTNYGLLQFDKESKQIKVWLEEDGINHNEFNQNAHYIDNEGTFYLGGYHGILAVDPGKIHNLRQSEETEIRILAIRQFDKGQGEWVEKRGGLEKFALDLPAGNQSFEVDFSAMDFRLPRRNYCAYKIEGLSESWIYTFESTVRIASLPPGEYVLRFKMKGRLGNWITTRVGLPITVGRYYYQSPWFYLLIGVVVVVLSWLRIRGLRKQREVLEQTVEERTETIRKQAEELKELDVAKSKFFANVSHELRTPLTLIKGPVALIGKKFKNDPEAHSWIRIVQNNTSSLLANIQELLDIARIDSSNLTLDPEAIELRRFLLRVSGAFESISESIEYSCAVECKPELMVRSDAGKLERILNNLLSNAFKFTPDQGTIQFTAHYAHGQLVCEVKDSGPGIPDDEQERIFDRYYQRKGDRSHHMGGAGIGLSLSREYAELMGGELNVKSENGKGSTFSLSIPVEEIRTRTTTPEPIPQEMETELVVENGPEPSPDKLNRPQILLVEDHHEMRAYVKGIFSDQYLVREAGNGNEALKYLSEAKVDLIISDIMMPQMDGYTFLGRLRKDKYLSGIPVILLTAKAAKEDRIKALRIGVEDYLTKPFDPEELEIRVRYLLNNASARRQSVHENPDVQPDLSHDEAWQQKVEGIVHTRLNDDRLNVEVLADEMAMSSRHFSRKLKSLTGLSAGKFIQEVRLQRARMLAEERKFSTIKEIAVNVGYADPQHFAKLYTSRFGASLKIKERQ